MTSTISMKNHQRYDFLIADGLQAVLNDTRALYQITHHYHFNVEGKNFYALHKLFEEQYNELFISYDEIGERIRAIGAYVDFESGNHHLIASSKLSKVMSIKDVEQRADQMVKDLVELHEKVIDSCLGAKKLAEDSKDDITADLMIQRIAALEKAKWMLSSLAK